MQLVAYGAQDVYLTGNPQITFFKVVYRRHTNFAIEAIEQQFTGSVGFGRRLTCQISRNGDLITKIYVRIVIPEIIYTGAPENKDLVKFAWVRRLGHAAIRETELEIGGAMIDKQYGDWLNIWYELSHAVGQERGYAEMIGDIELLTKLSELNVNSMSNVVKPHFVLFVPLKYFCCKNNGLALPLIALQYHEVKVHIHYREVSHLYVSNDYFQSAAIQMIDSSLLIDYIYLDTEERRRFAQVPHEYLIEQLQFTGEESVLSNTAKYKLTYNHPCKALFWAVKVGNFFGKKFMMYTDHHWRRALKQTVRNLTLSAFDLDPDVGNLINAATIPLDLHGNYVDNGITYKAINMRAIPAQNTLRISVNIDPDFPLPTDGNPYVIGLLDVSQLLMALLPTSPDLLTKFVAQLTVSFFPAGTGFIMIGKVNNIFSSSLTVGDISYPTAKFAINNRTPFIVKQDITVWQHDNYGMQLDGKVNPIEHALIQLNGHNRFERREGNYFNYVQPYQHFTDTPADGINVYSFALKPEEHQPSGTCNFSRIDTANLNLEFNGAFRGTFGASIFIDSDTKVFIYTVNYNVLRIMSGMGGLAYSN